MATRISNLAASSQLIGYMLRTQQRVHEAEVQVSSEKRSQDYQGIARESERLINIENASGLLTRYIQGNELLDLNLKISETALEGIDTTIRDFRAELYEFNSGDKDVQSRVEEIQNSAFRALKDMETYLNTEVNGRFIFAGTRVDTQPVSFGLTNKTAFQTKYDGNAVTYPIVRNNHIYQKLTTTSGHPTDTTVGGLVSDGFGDVSFADTSPDTITAATAGAFANVPVGSLITVSSATTGGNDGTYYVSANTGTALTVYASDGTTDAGLTADANDAAPTITVNNSYYSGDEQLQTHHASQYRDLTYDINGIDPAFEKAIRAMGIILQGAFSTAGGLDQNTARSEDAIDLLTLALEPPESSSSPYGTELSSNINQLSINLGYDRVLINQTNDTHTQLIAFYEERIINMENVDPTDAITRLLDETRALDASFQAMARIRQLSLSNYI